MTDQTTPQADNDRQNYDLPFYVRLVIPLATQETAPLTQDLALPRGESEYLWIEMPKGCAGLVGLQLWHYSRQVFPRPVGGWYISDNSTVRLRFREIFDDDKPTLQIRAYNLDQVYIHRPWIALEMASRRSGLADPVLAFLRFIGRSD